MKEISNKLGENIFNRLRKLIINPTTELEYNSDFELLIAVMLSAQCTDKRVNIITRELFKKYNTPYSLANIDIDELRNYIKSCNYFNSKAKNIILASKAIVENFDGQVPRKHDDLVSLAGVGNKTANVVQSVAFEMQTFPVDTHVLRVSNRLGISNTKNPDICEKDLKIIFEHLDWREGHHLILLFGRYYCTARSPKCLDCVLNDICKYYKQNKLGV